jgi:hypothetical protein
VAVKRFAEIAKKLKATYGAGIAVITGDREEGLIHKMQAHTHRLIFNPATQPDGDGGPPKTLRSLYRQRHRARPPCSGGRNKDYCALRTYVSPALAALFRSGQGTLQQSNAALHANCLPYEGYPCMSAITVDEVWEKIVTMLESR